VAVGDANNDDEEDDDDMEVVGETGDLIALTGSFVEAACCAGAACELVQTLPVNDELEVVFEPVKTKLESDVAGADGD